MNKLRGTKKVLTKTVLGWREAIDLPELKIKSLPAKIDSGARTSSLHAEEIEFVKIAAENWVTFFVSIEKSGQLKRIKCKAKLIATKKIKSSTGHTEVRPIIWTQIKMGEHTFDTPITLTDRSEMGFKMLIGRNTLRPNYIVDCAKSFQLPKQKVVSVP